MPRKTRPSDQTPAILDASAIEAIRSAVFLYKGEPVITLRQMDELHGRAPGAARHAFNRYKKELTPGKHYVKVENSDITELNERLNFTRSKKERGGYKGRITLLYKRGYLLLVKSFGDDLAWRIQDELVDAFERLEAIKRASAKAFFHKLSRYGGFTSSHEFPS
jgi:hypothetical protein